MAGRPESGFHRLSLARLRRSAAALCSRPGVAHASAAASQLSTRGSPPIEWKNSATATTISTRARSSPTSSPTSGSTSAVSRTRFMREQGHRLLREQPARHLCPAAIRHPTTRKRFVGLWPRTRWGLTAGHGPGPAAPAQFDGVRTAVLRLRQRAARLTVPTTARWRRGPRLLRYPSRRLSWSPPCAISIGPSLRWSAVTASSAVSIPPSRPARRRDGLRRATTPWTRGRSS